MRKTTPNRVITITTTTAAKPTAIGKDELVGLDKGLDVGLDEGFDEGDEVGDNVGVGAVVGRGTVGEMNTGVVSYNEGVPMVIEVIMSIQTEPFSPGTTRRSVSGRGEPPNW